MIIILKKSGYQNCQWVSQGDAHFWEIETKTRMQTLYCSYVFVLLEYESIIKQLFMIELLIGLPLSNSSTNKWKI